jgi:hypothetical protein
LGETATVYRKDVRRLIRRAFSSTILGFTVSYFLDRKRGPARRARARRWMRSLRAQLTRRLDQRRRPTPVVDV